MSVVSLVYAGLDNISAVTVWMIRGKIIRTVLCCIVCYSCAQS